MHLLRHLVSTRRRLLMTQYIGFMTIVFFGCVIALFSLQAAHFEHMRDLISHDFKDTYGWEPPDIPADMVKREAIKDAFRFGWNLYKKNCWGKDHLIPEEKKCSSDALGGGLTIVDSLTTLILMNLTQEYKEARDFVQNKFTLKGEWSTFELIIRYLASFISSYQLTNDKIFLEKAQACMDLVSDLVETDGNFKNMIEIDNTDGQLSRIKSFGDITLATIGTMQLEFLSMGMITQDVNYVYKAFYLYKRLLHYYPNYGFINNVFNYMDISSEYDSYYEYVLKSYLLTGKISGNLIKRHVLFMNDLKKHLVNTINDITFVGTAVKLVKMPNVHHLSTFLGGLIALGSVKANDNHKEDFQLARRLVDGYYKTYKMTKTGLMPEEFSYKKLKHETNIEIITDGYYLRPETVESIYYLWKMTGEQQYRDMAWDIFQSISKYCRTENGFSAIQGVDGNPHHLGKQESYFFSETLMYLYMTFSDSAYLPLSDWVFNTEGHPLKVWDWRTSRNWREEVV